MRKNCRAPFNKAVTKGLIIKPEWGELILSGYKTLEMRTKATNERGWHALIYSGTGKIYGLINITDSTGPYSNKQLIGMHDQHLVPAENIRKPDYKWRHAWHISDVVKFETPIPYTHAPGAVIWVNLKEKDRQAAKYATLSLSM